MNRLLKNRGYIEKIRKAISLLAFYTIATCYCMQIAGEYFSFYLGER